MDNRHFLFSFPRTEAGKAEENRLREAFGWNTGEAMRNCVDFAYDLLPYFMPSTTARMGLLVMDADTREVHPIVLTDYFDFKNHSTLRAKTRYRLMIQWKKMGVLTIPVLDVRLKEHKLVLPAEKISRLRKRFGVPKNADAVKLAYAIAMAANEFSACPEKEDPHVTVILNVSSCREIPLHRGDTPRPPVLKPLKLRVA
ncbi:MAG: hypothetical protein KGI97_05790 [Alphaproteobacteria bacterium]|nr:hypothetical protein [Alphaproteobacteria bacterium]